MLIKKGLTFITVGAVSTAVFGLAWVTMLAKVGGLF